MLDSELYKQLAELWQGREVAGVDAGNDVESHVWVSQAGADGVDGADEGAGRVAQPVVFRFQAVETYGERAQSGAAQPLEALGGERAPVGHHSPRELAAVELASHLLEVGAHQRFAAGDDYQTVMGVNVRANAVHDAEEILGRHVGTAGVRLAVAAAVQAVHVTAVGGFPEKLPQLVAFAFQACLRAPQLQRQALPRPDAGNFPLFRVVAHVGLFVVSGGFGNLAGFMA